VTESRQERSVPSWWREPGSGAYSRLEREWRWLLPRVPAGVSDAVTTRDRYLLGTTMRLRHMSGDAVDIYKLTQKVRPRADDPSVTAITNLYLRPEEHALLSTLPAAELVKIRHRWHVAGVDVAVDELLGRWRGMVVAELEHDGDTVVPALPDAVEVTFDDRFTGGALASVTDDQVAGLHEVARSLVKP
jgi:CYTH domain-containing protein